MTKAKRMAMYDEEYENAVDVYRRAAGNYSHKLTEKDYEAIQKMALQFIELRRSRRRDNAWVVGVGAVFFFLLVFWVVGILNSEMGKPEVTDPRVGVVEIDGRTVKFCDGTTLVYRTSRGVDVVPDSPECA